MSETRRVRGEERGPHLRKLTVTFSSLMGEGESEESSRTPQKHTHTRTHLMDLFLSLRDGLSCHAGMRNTEADRPPGSRMTA